MPAPTMIRIAAALNVVIAVGLGVFCIPAIGNLALGRDIPLVMGFPAYGHGPFERIGIRTTIPLLVLFLAVCIVQGVAGIQLWGGHRSDGVLSLVMVPVAGVFWWGFALPIPPIAAVVWSSLILLNWQWLR